MAVSEQSVLSLEYNQAPEVEVVVASNISLTDLKEITAETLNISQPVTLEYFDDDFDEWVAVDEEYQLPRQGKLRVTIVSHTILYLQYVEVNVSGMSASVHARIPLCW